jgi:hypothetical protein
MTEVVVAGALANKAGSGGEAWVRLSYALGLRRLGCEVLLVEEAPDAPEDAVDYARAAAGAFGLDFALAGEELAGADLLINVSGNLRRKELRRRFRRTAFVDIDPGFTQLWHRQGLEPIEEHDLYFTIATNIGSDDCRLPTCGIDWRPTRPPVVLDEWPAADGGFDRFTTVSTWRSPFGPIEPYSLKHHEWRKFVGLPVLTGLPFEAAISFHPEDEADRSLLAAEGWHLVDPAVSARPDEYRDYVRSSGAEFSVAQGIYVETASGWFSDRSVRYLASGRPVLLQDTGFGRDLPVGEGLLSFRTLDQAAAGARAIVDDYDRHASAARALAEEHFDSDKVLTTLLEAVL